MRLQIPVVPDLYENYIIEELEVKFILPEGADNVKYTSNIELTRGADSNRYTFLDTTGRVVVTTSGGKGSEFNIV